MVTFSETDFKIILSMSLVLIIISFLFPAMGFTPGDVNASEIPNFNASQNNLNFINQPPEPPGNPSEGQLEYTHGAATYEDNRQVWIQGDTVSITLINVGTQSAPDMEVHLNKFNDSGGFSTQSKISEGDFVTLEGFNWTVSFTHLQFTENNETVTVDWEVNQQPDETSWINAIPVIGGVANALGQIASIIGWLVSMVFHYLALVIQSIANIFILLANIISFILGFFYWLIATYGGVISAAPASYVSVFMAIPGALLSYEFAKLIILLINTISGVIPLT